MAEPLTNKGDNPDIPSGTDHACLPSDCVPKQEQFEQLTGPVIQTKGEFFKSAALLHDRFRQVKHFDADEACCHPLERNPSSVTLAVRDEAGEIVSRCTMVLMGQPEWSPSLPCMVQPEFAEIIDNTPGPKAEVTRLASASRGVGVHKTRALMDDIAMMSLALDLHSVFLVCHPKHEKTYVSFYEADPLKTVSAYAGIRGKPGTLMKITVPDFYHFTRWTPRVIENQVAGPIGREMQRMRDLYKRRVQAAEGGNSDTEEGIWRYSSFPVNWKNSG